MSFQETFESFLRRSSVLGGTNSQYFIKKGTTFYYGTIRYPLNEIQWTHTPTAFALERELSLWRILEETYRRNDRAHQKVVEVSGYLYEMELQDNLPIHMIKNTFCQDRLFKTIYDNTNTNDVFIHPALIYRGMPVETEMRPHAPLCTDLTVEILLVWKKYHRILKIKSIRAVNPHLLHLNVSNPDFVPDTSIVSKQVFGPMLRKTYLKLFHSDAYTPQEFILRFL